MKTQQETTIQFSGYPLRVVHENREVLITELALVKSPKAIETPTAGELLANNPQNWDIDWFNSYE